MTHSNSSTRKLRAAAERFHYSGDWPNKSDIDLLFEHKMIEQGVNQWCFIETNKLREVLGVSAS